MMPDETPDISANEMADYRDALIAIRDHLPACSADSETVWSDRVWNGQFRDLQRRAREVLRKHNQSPEKPS